MAPAAVAPAETELRKSASENPADKFVTAPVAVAAPVPQAANPLELAGASFPIASVCAIKEKE